MAAVIELLRAGTFTDMNGHQATISSADLADMASNYDPKKHRAPLVVGHPKHDDPAYGHVASLAVADGILVAIPEQVAPEFAEMVNAGRFSKVSASIYPADHPNNPTPGKKYLRHVGFLGAMAPAVKGLATVALGEAEETVICLAGMGCASHPAAEALARLKREKLVEEVMREGRLPPGWKDGCLAFMECLEDAGTIQFGEGAMASEMPPAEWFGKFLKSLPVQIPFGEVAADFGEGGDDSGVDLPVGYTTSAAGVELHRTAVGIQKQLGIGYADAVKIAAKRKN